MNKAQLVTAMAQKSELTKKDAQAALTSLQKVITKSLAEGDQVQINGFGTFALSYYPARTGRNPQTGASIEIEGANKAVFKASKALKDVL
ncbi:MULTISPECIES: HU family DNA-binding protein [Pseudoalteromonas]|uniref:DNA-binding protein HU-alpha (HU-2), likely to play a role in DNA replication and in rpo translation n=1 Tax=Pseudoalteromonas translucida (strain TAC 125) TaxID=326442 RepID=Q3IKW5_PSET1|nr:MULTISPECIES: HU family DNA-binding protein [Pseudoalteromonas]MBB1404280.1 HU family DNA-binding protein [Pseudoalteromonas sp. SG44-5]MBE0418642.1 HU family DNA-binding protein [Pseudoalteromonas nigrifaciens]PCC12700.1 HU family DNA-binding protein [Pseudoalteromonas sp. JB197]CAI86362.1 DNA-binding protein HU-alpha (HU-2), likely to play a role in DNA replication and in rpo translation [Pseudoalteromonas translucida]SJN36641.1 DNA-binding protein HU-alpha [Pseudoalteromonas sp. JB197]